MDDPAKGVAEAGRTLEAAKRLQIAREQRM